MLKTLFSGMHMKVYLIGLLLSMMRTCYPPIRLENPVYAVLSCRIVLKHLPY